MVSAQWYFLEVNPYPWKVPPISVGRRGGKVFPSVGRDEGLYTYKEAVREQVLAQNPLEIAGPVGLQLWFWRNIPEYTTPQGRRARKHEADTTNLQKATEDALQGLVYANDKDVQFISSTRVAQGPDVVGMLVICAWPFEYPGEVATAQMPDFIVAQVNEMQARGTVPAFNIDSEGEVPF